MRKLSFYQYSKDQEAEFLELIKQHDGIIGTIFRRFEWIDPSEYDDYRQEIYMHAWNDFHKYARRSDYAFGTWLFHTARWACTAFKRKCITYYKHHRFPEGFDFEILADDECGYDKEEQLKALEYAISELSNDDQAVVRMYGTLGEMRKLSLDQGYNENYYNGRFQLIKKKILQNRDKYFDQVFVYEKKKKQPGRRNETNSRSKPVAQYDTNGNLLKVWPSLQETGRNGFSHKAIHFALKSQSQLSQGFLWRYFEVKKTA